MTVERTEREKFTILVADDEEQNTRLLTRLLSESGFGRVLATTDSSEVIGLCERLRPDLLLLDLAMPEPTGFDILERLGKSGESPRAVVLSGHEHPSLQARATELGAYSMLSKTAGRQALIQCVDDALSPRGHSSRVSAS